MSRQSALVLLLMVLFPQHSMGKAKLCPQTVDTKVARSIIENWMAAEMVGAAKDYMAKESCVKTFKPKYNFNFPEYKTDPMSKDVDIFADTFKVKKLRKGSDEKVGTDYFATIEVIGKDKKGKVSKLEQEVLFTFPKKMESVVYGCAILHSRWKKSFLKKGCEVQ